jgi:hypothetical protein
MFHTHVAIVCFKCFIYFNRMLHPSVSCLKGIESLGHGLGAGVRRAMDQWLGRIAHLGSYGQGVLILMSTLRSRLPRDRGGGQGEGAAGAVFPAGARASKLTVVERERRGPGEEAAGAVFFAGAHG